MVLIRNHEVYSRYGRAVPNIQDSTLLSPSQAPKKAADSKSSATFGGGSHRCLSSDSQGPLKYNTLCVKYV